MAEGNSNIKNENFLHGSGGSAWVNDEQIAEVKSVELKVTGQFEDVNVAGDFATYHQYVGYSIEGTLTLQRVRTYAARLLKQAYLDGKMPDIKIVTKLENKTTGASERAAVTGVAFTEFALANFEAKSLTEEEIPIKASHYEFLEEI